ncbi:unnamed protein product [Adineta ricciae]|uniref:Uncharacterized protein n=1 Tax=Adineta ricciae TaxID=249248 RepID=A0A813V1T9_ADIRI|nr:unnamed protein product [Adineta ricciae]CAF1456967.1 unnamed protein product [Adineta ricciae]
MVNETIQQIASTFPISVDAIRPERKRSIIREFGLNTSTHAIPSIARSQSLLNRIFWCTALIIFVGIMFYFIITSIIDYFDYPTRTSVDFVVEWPQPFPAVTICNYSPLVYSYFIDSFLNYTNSRNLTNTTDTATFTRQQASYVRDFQRDVLVQGEHLARYAFPLESMLISCTYNNLPCSATNFTRYASIRYGNCYTFNGKRNNSVHYNSENAADGLLQLTLYLHRHQYVPYVTTGVGMMAIVHDNDEFPLITASGLQLIPGRSHTLAYSKRSNVFLSPPYTSCTNNVAQAMQALFDQYEGVQYGYKQYLCYLICMQTLIYQQCGCISPNNWATRFVVLPGSDTVIAAPLCNWTDSCSARVTMDFANLGAQRDKQCPGCGPECHSNTYQIKASALEAPMTFQLNDIKKFVESSSIPTSANWTTTWQNEIPMNYVSLAVMCETTQTEVYTQRHRSGRSTSFPILGVKLVFGLVLVFFRY